MIRKSRKVAVGLAKRLCFWCPGCDNFHAINVPEHHDSDQPMWSWDGDYENPTIKPSIKVIGTKKVRDEHGRWTGEWEFDENGNPIKGVCHSFIEHGRWRFLGDCTHHLAGQTVDMVDIPEEEI